VQQPTESWKSHQCNSFWRKVTSRCVARSRRHYRSIISMCCSGKPVEVWGRVLHPAKRCGTAPLRGAARLLRRGGLRRRDRRPVRLLHCLGAPDGHPAAQRKARAVRRGQARSEGAAKGHRRGAGESAGAARGRAQRRRDRRRPGRIGHPDLRADGMGHPRRCRASSAGSPRRGPPRQPRETGPGQGRRAAELADWRHDRLPARRAAAVIPGDGPTRAARPGRTGRLPVHQRDHRLAVDRHPAACQVRTPPPRPPHRRAHRRRWARARTRTDRAAQVHPRRLLLLPSPPRIQPKTAHRPRQNAA
jgi:hypothetical protein